MTSHRLRVLCFSNSQTDIAKNAIVDGNRSGSTNNANVHIDICGDGDASSQHKCSVEEVKYVEQGRNNKVQKVIHDEKDVKSTNQSTIEKAKHVTEDITSKDHKIEKTRYDIPVESHANIKIVEINHDTLVKSQKEIEILEEQPAKTLKSSLKVNTVDPKNDRAVKPKQKVLIVDTKRDRPATSRKTEESTRCKAVKNIKNHTKEEKKRDIEVKGRSKNKKTITEPYNVPDHPQKRTSSDCDSSQSENNLLMKRKKHNLRNMSHRRTLSLIDVKNIFSSRSHYYQDLKHAIRTMKHDVTSGKRCRNNKPDKKVRTLFECAPKKIYKHNKNKTLNPQKLDIWRLETSTSQGDTPSFSFRKPYRFRMPYRSTSRALYARCKNDNVNFFNIIKKKYRKKNGDSVTMDNYCNSHRVVSSFDSPSSREDNRLHYNLFNYPKKNKETMNLNTGDDRFYTQSTDCVDSCQGPCYKPRMVNASVSALKFKSPKTDVAPYKMIHETSSSGTYKMPQTTSPASVSHLKLNVISQFAGFFVRKIYSTKKHIKSGLIAKYLIMSIVGAVWLPCILVIGGAWLCTYPLRPHHLITNNGAKVKQKKNGCSSKNHYRFQNNPWTFMLGCIKRYAQRTNSKSIVRLNKSRTGLSSNRRSFVNSKISVHSSKRSQHHKKYSHYSQSDSIPSHPSFPPCTEKQRVKFCNVTRIFQNCVCNGRLNAQSLKTATTKRSTGTSYDFIKTPIKGAKSSLKKFLQNKKSDVMWQLKHEQCRNPSVGTTCMPPPMCLIPIDSKCNHSPSIVKISDAHSRRGSHILSHKVPIRCPLCSQEARRDVKCRLSKKSLSPHFCFPSPKPSEQQICGIPEEIDPETVDYPQISKCTSPKQRLPCTSKETAPRSENYPKCCKFRRTEHRVPGIPEEVESKTARSPSELRISDTPKETKPKTPDYPQYYKRLPSWHRVSSTPKGTEPETPDYPQYYKRIPSENKVIDTPKDIEPKLASSSKHTPSDIPIKIDSKTSRLSQLFKRGRSKHQISEKPESETQIKKRTSSDKRVSATLKKTESQSPRRSQFSKPVSTIPPVDISTDRRVSDKPKKPESPTRRGSQISKRKPKITSSSGDTSPDHRVSDTPKKTESQTSRGSQISKRKRRTITSVDTSKSIQEILSNTQPVPKTTSDIINARTSATISQKSRASSLKKGAVTSSKTVKRNSKESKSSNRSLLKKSTESTKKRTASDTPSKKSIRSASITKSSSPNSPDLTVGAASAKMGKKKKKVKKTTPESKETLEEEEEPKTKKKKKKNEDKAKKGSKEEKKKAVEEKTPSEESKSSEEEVSEEEVDETVKKIEKDVDKKKKEADKKKKEADKKKKEADKKLKEADKKKKDTDKKKKKEKQIEDEDEEESDDTESLSEETEEDEGAETTSPASKKTTDKKKKDKKKDKKTKGDKKEESGKVKVTQKQGMIKLKKKGTKKIKQRSKAKTRNLGEKTSQKNGKKKGKRRKKKAVAPIRTLAQFDEQLAESIWPRGFKCKYFYLLTWETRPCWCCFLKWPDLYPFLAKLYNCFLNGVTTLVMCFAICLWSPLLMSCFVCFKAIKELMCQ